MKPTNKLVKELETLINNGLDGIYFPYQKGNSIRIGPMIVRSNKKGFYLVYDTRDNIQVARTFCKSSAVAIAKKLAQGTNCVEKILEIDKRIQKFYNDAVFYKYTMNITTDDVKRDITATRYDIAKCETEAARNRLDQYIFS